MATDAAHPVHLHRHALEVGGLNDRATAGSGFLRLFEYTG